MTEKNDKIYIIVAGVNGTGKSSFRGAMFLQSDYVTIDADKIAKENNCSAVKAGRIAVEKINDCLGKGISFRQETTLSGNKTLNTIKRAKEKGYFVVLLYIGLNSVEESIKRIKNRVEKGGHNIDEETVRRRYATRFADIAKVLPFCDGVLFYDNENGFNEVGAYFKGLRNLEALQKQPQWFIELEEHLKKNNLLS